jgi:hypothetical protein
MTAGGPVARHTSFNIAGTLYEFWMQEASTAILARCAFKTTTLKVNQREFDNVSDVRFAIVDKRFCYKEKRSSLILDAWADTVRPSPSMCLLKRMPMPSNMAYHGRSDCTASTNFRTGALNESRCKND